MFLHLKVADPTMHYIAKYLVIFEEYLVICFLPRQRNSTSTSNTHWYVFYFSSNHVENQQENVNTI